ncbi:LAMI_0D09274g1_1 [Lachancea mirantina]|uniref:protein-serine/threonine phosphatase n=1 Tax=Lachancea mirantina TaxID=1230905 RepID=A0A1G4JDI7_9SACH|nr:LAMI_0D09274g1_1 [Lachancea mirantina]
MGQLLSHPLVEKTIEYNQFWQEAKPKEVRGIHRPHFSGRSESFNSNKSNQGERRSLQFFNCVGSMQGYRLTQEDAHLVANGESSLRVHFFDPFRDRRVELSLSIFGIFDGHGGDECSKFVSGQRNGDEGIRRWIAFSFENHKYGSKHNSNNRNSVRLFDTIDGLISQILKDAFIHQDNELYSHLGKLSCGTTAVLAVIIDGKSLYVANAGDSRCILATKGKGVKTLSFDHKPQHIGELVRINDDGGTVSLGRVGGVLALSRAFGDFQFKSGVPFTRRSQKNTSKFTTPPQESQVTAEPDVVPHTLDFDKDEFLVLACDGIWDVYSNKNLLQFVKFHLTLGLKFNEIVTKLLDHGIGSADSNTGVGFDNMTLIIVALNKPDESLAQWYAKMKLRLERAKGITT